MPEPRPQQPSGVRRSCGSPPSCDQLPFCGRLPSSHRPSSHQPCDRRSCGQQPSSVRPCVLLPSCGRRSCGPQPSSAQPSSCDRVPSSPLPSSAAGTHGQRLRARLFGGGGFFVAHLWKLLLVSSVAVARLTIGRTCSRDRTRPAATIEPCRQASFIGPAIQRGSSSSTRASAAHVRKRDKLGCASSGRGCGQWTVLLLSRAHRLSVNVLRIGFAHAESAIPRLAHACQQKATVSSRV